MPFIGITPCRVADTRGNGFTGAYGPPSLVANANRNFTIIGQCGIPSTAKAVSFNFGALNVGGAGDLRIFPAGGSLPLVSTLNYNASTPNIANAGIVPLSAGGAITVRADAVSIDLIIDVNGYYATTPAAVNGNGFYVFGTFPSTAAIWGENAGNNDVAGVLGDATASASSFPTLGVAGRSCSTHADSSGVGGVDGTLCGGVFVNFPGYATAGVRGESSTGNGVLGVSRFSGVAGSVVDAFKAELAYGILGFNNGTVYGVFAGGAFGGTGAKYFVEPHPSDASKVIRYVSLEGPEAGTYFRGRGRFQNGLATIDVPEDFRMVTDSEGLSIQVTPIGELATVAVVRIDLEEILVKASRNVEFFYTVNGVRRTHRDLKPIGPGSEFMPRSADARIPAYLTEGQKALLVSNGTYNADATVNMETAERLGWTKIWADREAHATTLAAANAAARAARLAETK